MSLRDIFILDNILAIAAIITALTIIFIFSGRVIKFFKKAVHFFDDFAGEEERPGVPRRPGFSERMKRIENCMTEIKSKIELVEYTLEKVDMELQVNSGKTLKDAVLRIEKRLNVVETREN